jgi:type VI protein secretion system component VasK
MNNFSQWLWLMIWWFLFVVYLIILFQIIGDMFRDHALSGWAKAAWIIGLIFLPFLVALIYIIARGRGMAERQVQAVQTAQANTDTYIRSVAGSGKSPAEQITDAKALLDSGTISQAEFDALKAKALA